MLDLWNHSDFQTVSTNAGDTTEIIKGLNEATTSIVDWTTHPIVRGNNPEDYVEDEDDMRMKEKMKNHQTTRTSWRTASGGTSRSQASLDGTTTTTKRRQMTTTGSSLATSSMDQLMSMIGP